MKLALKVNKKTRETDIDYWNQLQIMGETVLKCQNRNVPCVMRILMLLKISVFGRYTYLKPTPSDETDRWNKMAKLANLRKRKKELGCDGHTG